MLKNENIVINGEEMMNDVFWKSCKVERIFEEGEKFCKEMNKFIKSNKGDCD